MYEALKKESIKLSLTESEIRSLIKDVLLEELGSFHGQYDVAKHCADVAKDMQSHGIMRKTIDTSAISNEIESVEINIINGMALRMANGFDPETRKAIISIGSINLTDEKLFNQLPNAISHELMHCNVFLKRYFSGQEPSCINSEQYGKITAIMAGENRGNPYDFAYAIYSTNFEEVNAFVSQVSGQILDSIGKNATKEEILDAYRHCNSVLAFKNNIKIAELALSNEEICQEIIGTFENYGLELSSEEVKHFSKRIIKISQEALKDCARNAMIAIERKERKIEQTIITTG